MMTRLLASALFVTLPAFVSAQAPVSVYVTSAGAQAGLTDPSKDNQDTVKDLKGDLRKAKDVRLVESASEALIILRVLGRETGPATMQKSLDGTISSSRDYTTRVQLVGGGVDTVLSASFNGADFTSFGAWGKNAGKIAKQVQAWIVANRATLEAN